MAAGKVTGSCHCKAVSFEIVLPTEMCGHCHCESCRKSHASAFVTWTSVPDVQFKILADHGVVTDYRSSEHATRSFCNHCGSHVAYRSTALPGRTYVPLALLDGKINRQPESHVNCKDAVPWITIADDLPKFAEFD